MTSINGNDLAFGWPDAQWNWTNETDYNSLQWIGPGQKPTKAAIEAARASRLASLEPDPNAPYSLSKAAFIGRMTSDEAALFDGMLAEAGAAFRLTFNLADPLDSSSDYFASLRAGLVGAGISATRADQLLARE
jgi:hypothetical protein